MLAASQDNATHLDELDRYVAEGMINIGTSTALEWWTNTAQRTRFPTYERYISEAWRRKLASGCVGQYP